MENGKTPYSLNDVVQQLVLTKTTPGQELSSRTLRTNDRIIAGSSSDEEDRI
jgi:hypothetical protein